MYNSQFTFFTDPLENEDCAICKDSFAFIPPDSTTEPSAEDKAKNKEDAQPQEALTLPCKHSFHEECIVPWVRVKGTCPVCRFELVGQAGGVMPGELKKGVMLEGGVKVETQGVHWGVSPEVAVVAVGDWEGMRSQIGGVRRCLLVRTSWIS